MKQFKEFLMVIYRNFVPEPRSKMRNALKYYVANGCISSNVRYMREQ